MTLKQFGSVKIMIPRDKLSDSKHEAQTGFRSLDTGLPKISREFQSRPSILL
ncbi:hypothetical protein EC9_32310 [Rosistilla ulvae]|uniref:Uncharacterized protein n=1 Tax=Rosistilla ulvae TaxID=1930277 RepID=A0A517M2C9_9BACT|nr:hypothetical protein EC9_32310 [Rosistilla ulvae]